MSALELAAETTATPTEWRTACEAAYPKVYRALIAMGATPDDSADALQDAFEDSLRQRRPARSPEGWLFVVALRHWRRGRWRARLFRPLDLLRARLVTTERDDEIDLLAELARLSERQRSVLVARYAVGLSQREVAELLGISPGTVGAIAHQAATKIRERQGGSR